MIMNTISIAEFRKNMATYLDTVKYKRKPILVGKRNRPDFVIIPALSEEDREMYNSKNFWKELEEAREQVRQGNYYTLDEVKERIRKRKESKTK